MTCDGYEYVIYDFCKECQRREQEKADREAATKRRAEQPYSTDPVDPHMNFEELSEFFRGRRLPYRRLTPQPPIVVAKALKAAKRVQRHRTIRRPFSRPFTVFDGGWCIGSKEKHSLFIEEDGRIVMQTTDFDGQKKDFTVKPRKVTADEMYYLHRNRD
jgi:hypothetical protein